jgi:DUF4097 and DUF4098 domain-containing protein YvlB
MVRIRKTFYILTMITLLLFTGCSNTVTTEEFLQAYQVRSGTVIEVINPNGSVTISGWDEDRVEIRATKNSYFGQEALDQVDINIDIAETLFIETVHPYGETRVSVSYEIKLPGDLAVGSIECSNGDINLENIGGNPDLRTSNGKITASGINGIISARSSNGDINVSGVRSLAGLNTSNGSISAELPALHENLDIQTSNGSITLLMSPALEADIKANTSNGSLDFNGLNIETSAMDQTSLTGTMNGGGFNVQIATSNGSIKLEPLR